MFSLQRLLLLALLPVILLLGSQKKYEYLLSPDIVERLQLASSLWIPEPLQELILGRPRITVKQGTALGVTIWDTLRVPVDSFRGIPYALPPIGERRFRPAVPAEESDHIFDASQFGARYETSSRKKTE